MVQVTSDAVSHVTDLAKISKTVTMIDHVLQRAVNVNTIQINALPVVTKVVSAAVQVRDNAAVPLVAADQAAAATWSPTALQESRDTTGSPSKLMPDSNLKWTKWMVLPDNAQVTVLTMDGSKD